jgi:hypothetical protein
MYEVHGTQRDTRIHPGDTFNLDYSVTQILPLQKNQHRLLQLGVVGYRQNQVTDRSGPTITSAQASAHYRANAIGGAVSVILAARKAAIYFESAEGV